MKGPINKLEHLTHCPVCHKPYDRYSVTILEQAEQKATLHLSCLYCQASSIIFVVVNQSGVLSLGMVADITREEALRVINQEAISQDEVMGIHEKLKQAGRIEEII